MRPSRHYCFASMQILSKVRQIRGHPCNFWSHCFHDFMISGGGTRRTLHSTMFQTSPETSSSSSSKTLSRAKRRAMERKQRNKERRNQAKEHSQKTEDLVDTSKWNARVRAIQSHLKEFFHPRVVGSGQRIHRDHLWTLLVYRLPIACLMGYLATDPDISPYTIQASLGPSMLPTIQFIGDLWLVESGAWMRMLGWDWSRRVLQTGDVVLWKDDETGRVSCKRIVGMPGDSVRRYGEYAALYRDDENYGIVWPNKKPQEDRRVLPSATSQWDCDRHNHDINRTIKVPEHHVWLEGDCPPFSLDSRHYGPIPMKNVCGRLILRLWPWNDNLYFEDLPSRQSKWIRTMSRPTPYASAEDYLGKRFNFYKVKSAAKTENETQSASETTN